MQSMYKYSSVQAYHHSAKVVQWFSKLVQWQQHVKPAVALSFDAAILLQWKKSLFSHFDHHHHHATKGSTFPQNKNHSMTVWGFFNSKSWRRWWRYSQWRSGEASNNKVSGYREICNLSFKSFCSSHGFHPEFPSSWCCQQKSNSCSKSALKFKSNSTPIFSFSGCQVHQFCSGQQAEILPLKILSHPLLLPECLLLLHRQCSLHPSMIKQDSDSLLQLILLQP